MPAERKRTALRGFTLLELLVVIAIVALVAATATVRLSGSYRRAQLRRAAEQITEIDQYARQLAASQRARHDLKIDIDRGSLTLQRVDRPDGVARQWRIEPPIRIDAAATARENRRAGEVVVRYHQTGGSDTYAVAVQSVGGDSRWLLYSGGSGQLDESLSERNVDRLLRSLANYRSYAD